MTFDDQMDHLSDAPVTLNILPMDKDDIYEYRQVRHPEKEGELLDQETLLGFYEESKPLSQRVGMGSEISTFVSPHKHVDYKGRTEEYWTFVNSISNSATHPYFLIWNLYLSTEQLI
eukprot:UN24086